MDNTITVPMSIETLNEYLPKIGWSIKGIKPNQWLFNAYGKRTMLHMIGTERFEIPSKDLLGQGGEWYSNNGGFHLAFKECEIQYHTENGEPNFISIGPKGIDGVFLNLYKKD